MSLLLANFAQNSPSGDDDDSFPCSSMFYFRLLHTLRILSFASSENCKGRSGAATHCDTKSINCSNKKFISVTLWDLFVPLPRVELELNQKMEVENKNW